MNADEQFFMFTTIETLDGKLFNLQVHTYCPPGLEGRAFRSLEMRAIRETTYQKLLANANAQRQQTKPRTRPKTQAPAK